MVISINTSDETVASYYRESRNVALSAYEELIRRGYKVTHKGTPVTAAGATEELKITKTSVKEI